MKFARIINGFACDVRGTSPDGFFTPNIVAEFQSVPNEVENGWFFDDGILIEPVPHVPTEEEIAAAAAEAASVLQEKKDIKWEEIKAYRDSRILLGGFPASGHWYYSDLLARSQHQSNARKADLVAAANGDMDATFLIDGNPLYIKTIDNGYMAMTANIAIEIMANAEIQEYKNYSVALVHKSAMSASPNPSSYDFSTGWPEAFGVD